MTGKWHLGHMHGTPPAKRGFMRSLCAPIGELYFPDQKQRRKEGILLNGERRELDDPIFGKNWYGPDLLTDWGLKFIDEAIAEKKPFFYYMPHSSVHFPLQVPKPDFDNYHGKYLVGWPVRDDDHLDVGDGLGEHTVQSQVDGGGVIVGRDDHQDAGSGRAL